MHRLDLSVAILAICYGWRGACYAVTEPTQLVSAAALLAAIANVLLFLGGGLALNTAADVNTDAQHAGKATLVGAAERTHVSHWSATEIVVGVAAAIAVTALTGHALPAIAGTVTALSYAAYNLDMLGRLKHKGFVGALVYGAATGGLPFLVSAGAVVSRLPGWAWWLAIGLTTISAGRTAWWSVPDLLGDRKAGAYTPSVRHGAYRTTAVACLFMAVGLAAAAAGLWRFGPIQTTLAMAAHLVVFAIAANPLLRRGAKFPSWRTITMRILPLITLGEVLVLAVPLVTLLGVPRI
ncbi:UbiA family prenyltransferase [Amycolatopsis sp. GM8]|uniref:UbiA family prenyltransferase n=1 Tax=Amycolatopsis sp. GM8 TaxID=2896530 RepID=UPI0027E02565|nr:UbiA family prenyltransferase [Amycolatopsis sp. GM8]